jgi:hypothetical protein
MKRSDYILWAMAYFRILGELKKSHSPFLPEENDPSQYWAAKLATEEFEELKELRKTFEKDLTSKDISTNSLNVRTLEILEGLFAEEI